MSNRNPKTTVTETDKLPPPPPPIQGGRCALAHNDMPPVCAGAAIGARLGLYDENFVTLRLECAEGHFGNPDVFLVVGVDNIEPCRGDE